VQTRLDPAQRALVLVVDDEEAMLEVFTESLQRLGVDVVGESDPREAARHVRDGDRFDVVVLDLRMPHVDGFALLEQIRAKQPDVPVIVVTGYPSAESAKRCRELGVLLYLRKPFDPEDLNRQVRRALCPLPRAARANEG
jgi:DNA-binding NtrC family response regulator